MTVVSKNYINNAISGSTWSACPPQNIGDMAMDANGNIVTRSPDGSIVSVTNNTSKAYVDMQGDTHMSASEMLEYNLTVFKRLPITTREEVIHFITIIKPILDDLKSPQHSWGGLSLNGANTMYSFLSSKFTDEQMIKAHAEACIADIVEE